MPECNLVDLLVNLGQKGVKKHFNRVMEQVTELQFSGSALALSIVNQRFHCYSFRNLSLCPAEHTVI